MKRVYFRSRSIWSSLGFIILLFCTGAKFYTSRACALYNFSEKQNKIILTSEDIKETLKIPKNTKNLSIAIDIANINRPTTIIIDKIDASINLKDFVLAFFRDNFKNPILYLIKDLSIINNSIESLPKKLNLESVAIDCQKNSGLVLFKVLNQEKYFSMNIDPKKLKITKINSIDYQTKDKLQKKLLTDFLGFKRPQASSI